MPVTNNTELKALIADELKRTDKGTQIIDWIRLAEKMIARELTRNGMEQLLEAEASITTDAQVKGLPGGLRGRPSWVYLDRNPIEFLRYMTPADFYTRWLSTETSRPKAYTIKGNDIVFGPSPDESYTAIVGGRFELDIAGDFNKILIPYQDETAFDNTPATEGTFSGGTGHAVNDVITIDSDEDTSGIATVRVDAVSAGVVTEFTIMTTSQRLLEDGVTLSQVSTSGSGASFSLTPETDNLSNMVLQSHPDLYLHGALMHGYLDIRNDAEFRKHAAMFAAAIEAANDESFFSGQPMQVFVPQASAGAPPRGR